MPEQIQWVEQELKASSSDWKIVVFHHPLYSSGERHGSDLRLREVLEPLFLKYNVSVVLNGHDHFYERVKPQKGIQYFVVGSGGQLRAGNIDRQSGITAKGFDTDLVFMAAVGIELDEAQSTLTNEPHRQEAHLRTQLLLDVGDQLLALDRDLEFGAQRVEPLVVRIRSNASSRRA